MPIHRRHNLNRYKIISSERFRVLEHIFNEAGLLLKNIFPPLGCRQVDILLSTVILTRRQSKQGKRYFTTDQPR
jgi:hypothetical protein